MTNSNMKEGHIPKSRQQNQQQSPQHQTVEGNNESRGFDNTRVPLEQRSKDLSSDVEEDFNSGEEEEVVDEDEIEDFDDENVYDSDAEYSDEFEDEEGKEFNSINRRKPKRNTGLCDWNVPAVIIMLSTILAGKYHEKLTQSTDPQIKTDTWIKVADDMKRHEQYEDLSNDIKQNINADECKIKYRELIWTYERLYNYGHKRHGKGPYRSFQSWKYYNLMRRILIVDPYIHPPFIMESGILKGPTTITTYKSGRVVKEYVCETGEDRFEIILEAFDDASTSDDNTIMNNDIYNIIDSESDTNSNDDIPDYTQVIRDMEAIHQIVTQNARRTADEMTDILFGTPEERAAKRVREEEVMEILRCQERDIQEDRLRSRALNDALVESENRVKDALNQYLESTRNNNNSDDDDNNNDSNNNSNIHV